MALLSMIFERILGSCSQDIHIYKMVLACLFSILKRRTLESDGIIVIEDRLLSAVQLSLFGDKYSRPYSAPYPSTRFQGSKRTLIEWIWANTCDLPFDSVLDVFGGTGIVSHTFKTAGKEVIYNDNLSFNWQIGKALIENDSILLSPSDVEVVLGHQAGITYPDFIETTFKDIYFTDEENQWLDRVVFNIEHHLNDPFKQSIARFALFQACIIKRPYNLFHRANLYMRNAKVTRSFGNKTTWDTSFETHFRVFVDEANAAIFSNGRKNRALHLDALETPIGADLVYLDPPYLNARGIGVDYRDFYHFLEGLIRYDEWHTLIDYNSRHRRLLPQSSAWNRAMTISAAFEQVVARHHQSIIVLSYRDDGIPSKADLLSLLRRYKSEVREIEMSKKYVLSNRASHELLLIGL